MAAKGTKPPAIALQELATLTEGYGPSLAASEVGPQWASATGGRIHVWNDIGVTETITAPGATDQLRFTSDGHRLLACPWIYDLERHEWPPLPSLGEQLIAGLKEPPRAEQFAVLRCAWSPDATELVVTAQFRPTRRPGAVDSYEGPNERLLLLRGDTRKLLQVLDEGDSAYQAVAISDQFIAAAGKTIVVWRRANHEKVAELARHPVVVRELAWSRDGQRLAAAGADGLITLWDANGWTLLAAWQGHTSDLRTVKFHPQQPVLVTGGLDRKLKLWSLTAPGQLLVEREFGGVVEALAFPVQGQRMVVAEHGFPARLLLFRWESP